MSSFELELIKKLEEKQNILSQKIDIIDVNLQRLIHELQNIDGYGVPKYNSFGEENKKDSEQLITGIEEQGESDSNQDESEQLITGMDEYEQEESTDSNMLRSEIPDKSPFITMRIKPTIYPKMDIATNIHDYIETEIEGGKINLYYCYFSTNTSSLFPFVVYSVESEANKINLNELMVNNEVSRDNVLPTDSVLSTNNKSSVKTGGSIDNNREINFPSISIDINEEPNIEKYLVSEGTYIGYIPHKENPSTIYLFYRVKSPEFLPGKCATINELCHLKSVDQVKIGASIDDLFSQNKQLIYTYDAQTDEPIDVPFSGYLCDVAEDDATTIVNTNNAIDTPLFESDIFKIGLQGEYYYLTEKPLDLETPTTRYAIFPMNATSYDPAITDYSDYNSVFYSSDNISFWAIQSIKQISKI